MFPRQGALPDQKGVLFRIWAPRTEQLSVRFEEGRVFPLEGVGSGYFECYLLGKRPGRRYQYQFPDGRLRPDPASRRQEDSVHGPSTVTSFAYPWTDRSWRGLPHERLVFYELHVGVMGGFEGVARELPRLRELGITALELMPIAAYDGPRGWGYDGVAPYAVHAPYGSPRELMALVDRAHALGLAVILDVVYNHLGPSGNYLREFAPYFTSAYQTPWGDALNFDGPDAGPVRAFFIDNALQWIREFHFDGLRLDAVHSIIDRSRPRFVEELNRRIQAEVTEREVHLIAESDANEPSLLREQGFTAVWNDDFHHALHALVTGERGGYYADFGPLEALGAAFRDGYVRERTPGASSRGIPPNRFVVFAQNHDQIGNRARGERLSSLVPLERLRWSAAALLLSPHVPLLFMGEEYGETAPFPYFTSFPDVALARAIREGRRREFEAFLWEGEIPDPQALETFETARLVRRESEALEWTREMLSLRREWALGSSESREVFEGVGGLRIEMRRPGFPPVLLLLSDARGGSLPLPPPERGWMTLFDTHAPPGAIARGSCTLSPWQARLLVLLEDSDASSRGIESAHHSGAKPGT